MLISCMFIFFSLHSSSLMSSVWCSTELGWCIDVQTTALLHILIFITFEFFIHCFWYFFQSIHFTRAGAMSLLWLAGSQHLDSVCHIVFSGISMSTLMWLPLACYSQDITNPLWCLWLPAKAYLAAWGRRSLPTLVHTDDTQAKTDHYLDTW